MVITANMFSYYFHVIVCIACFKNTLWTIQLHTIARLSVKTGCAIFIVTDGCLINRFILLASGRIPYHE